MGKIQVEPLIIYIYISWKKECSHNFNVSSEETTAMRYERIKAKYIKEYVWKSFFCKLADWHLSPLLQINFFTDGFQEYWLNEHLPMATCRSYTKWLKSICEMAIVYTGWNPATCTWNKQSPRGVLSKRCSEKFLKIQR